MLFHCETQACAFGTANPIRLHQTDFFGPALQVAQGIQQFILKGSDAKKPLRQLPPLHRRAGTPAATINDLFVGQHRMLHRVPVNPGFPAIGQVIAKQIQKQFLLLTVVFHITGGEFPAPIQGKPHGLQLPAHIRNILIGPLGGMDLLFQGGVLRRQSEGVPTHGVQDVKPARPFIARHHITHGIVAYMAHMDASGRIGKHLQDVVFLFLPVFHRLKGLGCGPGGLPFSFCCLGVVARHGSYPFFGLYQPLPGRPNRGGSDICIKTFGAPPFGSPRLGYSFEFIARYPAATAWP